MSKGAYIRTAEMRKRASEIQKGRPSSFKGKHHSKKSREKIGFAQKQRERWFHSNETRRKIGEAQKGQMNHNWKGGSTHDGEGRIVLTLSIGRIRRARHTVETFLRRKLSSSEIIHHINEIRTDDRQENLFLFRHQAAHMRWHHFLRRHGLKGFLLKSNLGDDPLD